MENPVVVLLAETAREMAKVNLEKEALLLQARRTNHLASNTSKALAQRGRIATTGILQSAEIGKQALVTTRSAPFFTW